MNNINIIKMKYPSSWHSALWREGLASGNGEIGVNFYGGIGKETVLINHARLWRGIKQPELPDVGATLMKTRCAMDENRFCEANWILSNALKDSGYKCRTDAPLPLAALELEFHGIKSFSDYQRTVNMQTGEVTVCHKENGIKIKKELFVSRADNIIIMRVCSEKPCLNAFVSLDAYADDNCNKEYGEHIKSGGEISVSDEILTFSAVNADETSYGAAARIKTTGGNCASNGVGIKITGASEIFIVIKVFVKNESTTEKLKNELLLFNGDYIYYLNRHKPLHSQLYDGASIDFGCNLNRSNEELLLDAYGSGASNELIEKLWRYGRYLFISGTKEGGLPFAMYGLWSGEYKPTWCHNMANENIQMLYWHTNVGNLRELNIPFFEYYNGKMDFFRENAKKLYGCNGIFVTAGTTPEISRPNQITPVIMNWIGCGGWLAQHYYAHYIYTRDEDFLYDTALPFMTELADFYEDFIVYDGEGKVKLYPSVSPENTPANFIPQSGEGKVHPMPTAINSTIDLAILKELLTNLVEISENHNIFTERAEKWRKIIKKIPAYEINEVGAVREWQDKRFTDRYFHRHLSHIYPVFPGNEINTNDDAIDAFEKAVDMREPGAQTGWSLAHMASIYARLGRGNDAMDCLDNMIKSCMQNNFLTVHNDWRRMGISIEMAENAPIQLDALLGYVNAVQEMILYSSKRLIKLLPALPDNLKKGQITEWRFTGGVVNMKWDIDNNLFRAELRAERDMSIDIIIPNMFDNIICRGNCKLKQKSGLIAAEFKRKSEIIISTQEVQYG